VTLRWWRACVLVERDGDPWTWTFHVRAFTERNALRLVAQRVGGPHAVIACHASDPLPKAAPVEEVVADFGPWRRSFADPAMAPYSGMKSGEPTTG
jgi:hypothetical protein